MDDEDDEDDLKELIIPLVLRGEKYRILKKKLRKKENKSIDTLICGESKVLKGKSKGKKAKRKPAEARKKPKARKVLKQEEYKPKQEEYRFIAKYDPFDDYMEIPHEPPEYDEGNVSYTKVKPYDPIKEITIKLLDFNRVLPPKGDPKRRDYIRMYLGN